MSVLHPRRTAPADRSRLMSYDQARTTAVGRRQAGVVGQGTDRPRAAVCGDMRKRPAAQAPQPTAPAVAPHREVTIRTVRAVERQSSLEENVALFKAARDFSDRVMRRALGDQAFAELQEQPGEHRFDDDHGTYPPDAVPCGRCNALDGYDLSSNTCLQCTHAVVGRLILQLRDEATTCWQITPGFVKIQQATVGSDARKRAALSRIAETQGWTYDEQGNAPRIRISAAATVDSTAVEVWGYVSTPAAPGDADEVASGPARDADGPSAALLPKHTALGELILKLRGEPINKWELDHGQVKAHYWLWDKSQVRPGMQALAARLGWDYQEDEPSAAGEMPGAVHVAVVGSIGGVPVEVWAYAGAPEAAAPPRVPAARVDDPDADTSYTGVVHTVAQLDGRACTGCGAEFGADDTKMPGGLDLRGNQLSRHAGCPEQRGVNGDHVKAEETTP